jgi:hypothetical protein
MLCRLCTSTVEFLTVFLHYYYVRYYNSCLYAMLTDGDFWDTKNMVIKYHVKHLCFPGCISEGEFQKLKLVHDSTKL